MPESGVLTMRVRTVAAACATAVAVSLVSPSPAANAAIPQVHSAAVQLEALVSPLAPTDALRSLSLQVGAWIWSVGDALIYPAVVLALPALVFDPERTNPI